jgi:hypothetical protein
LAESFAIMAGGIPRPCTVGRLAIRPTRARAPSIVVGSLFGAKGREVGVRAISVELFFAVA